MAAPISLPVAIPSDRRRPAESSAPSNRVLPFLTLFLLTAAPLSAQGVDGAAIGGRVRGPDIPGGCFVNDPRPYSGFGFTIAPGDTLVVAFEVKC